MNIERLITCIESQTDPEPFSGAVSLTRGADVLFERPRGLAIQPESIPNKINTRFQIASGSKIFTAVAILQLVEQGKLSLSTLLADCLDVALPNFSPDITIGHLLTHSSGITSYFEEDVDPDYEAVWKDIPVYRIREPKDFLPLMADKPRKFPPGEKFEYNDGGFILLGLAIEHASGASFVDYVTRSVFEQAGMEDSGYFASDMLPERTARSYIRNPDGTMRTNVFAVPVIGAPDGGAYTTASDMVRFWNSLRSGKLLSSGTVQSMLQPQIATGLKEPFGHYGYGVWIEHREEKIRKLFVEGYDPGVAFRSAIYPDEDVILTLIGNTSEALWPLYRAIETELSL